MTVTAIESLEQFKEIINGKKIVISQFFALWSPACVSISPVFEKLSEQADLNTKIAFYKVLTDLFGDITEEAGVDAVPTFVAYKEGQIIGNVTGSNSSELEAFVKRLATI